MESKKIDSDQAHLQWQNERCLITTFVRKSMVEM